MTMTSRAMDWLTERGIDVELAARLGLDSSRRGAGEALLIPTTRDGRVVARKFRLFDGTAYDLSQKWIVQAGGETCFWNEDVLRDTSLDRQPLVITEGHWDAIVAIQCGFPRTVSVPNGAQSGSAGDPASKDALKFVQAVAPLLTKDRFPEIILAVDADPPGQQLLHDLSVQVGRYRAKCVDYGTGAKDLNDVLRRDGAGGVAGCLTAARYVSLPGLQEFDDLDPLPPDTIYEIGLSGSVATQLVLVGDCYKMRLGDLAIITGVPGYGKTSFVNDIVCRVADHYDLRVAWASFEQTPQRDLRRILTKWFAGKDEEVFASPEAGARWLKDHHVVISAQEDEDVTLDWLVDAMEGAVVRFGCKIIVVDPWNEIEHCRAIGESETEYVGRAIRLLKRFAKKFQVHLILVAHPAKLQKENGKYAMPSLYDISGSANFYNKADIGLIIHRQGPDETHVRIQKVRHHGVIGRPGEVRLDFDGKTQRFIEREKLA